LKSKNILFLSVTLLCFSRLSGQSDLLKYDVTIYDSVQSKGYYFIFTYKMRKRDAPGMGQQMILDGNGHTLYYRITPKASDFKMHPNGMMSYFGGNKFMIMNSNFEIVDSVGCINGIETDNHDFIILPNGHYLLIGTKSRTEDLSSYRIFMQKKMSGSKHAKLKFGVVQELDKKKKLLYQWDSEPYFKIQDADELYLNDSTSLDVTHFNSVEKDLNGNIYLSARYSNEVIKVDVSTGKLVWRMGGKKNQFHFENDSIPFLGQHDARIMKNGNLTVFDNGYGKEESKHNARALEYAIDEKKMTARLVWSFENEQKIISEATGNMQRLPNGNTLINYGKIANGTPNITFEEVTTTKKKVISLSFSDTVGSYRAFHYSQLPFTIHQPIVKAKIKNGRYYLRVTKPHSGYSWSNGLNSQEIEITQPGKYYVYVPYGDGGWISSKLIIVTNELLSQLQNSAPSTQNRK